MTTASHRKRHIDKANEHLPTLLDSSPNDVIHKKPRADEVSNPDEAVAPKVENMAAAENNSQMSTKNDGKEEEKEEEESSLNTDNAFSDDDCSDYELPEEPGRRQSLLLDIRTSDPLDDLPDPTYGHVTLDDEDYATVYRQVFGYSTLAAPSTLDMLKKMNVPIFTSITDKDKGSKYLDVTKCAKRTQWQLTWDETELQKRSVVIAIEVEHEGRYIRNFAEVTGRQLCELYGSHAHGKHGDIALHTLMHPGRPLHLTLDLECDCDKGVWAKKLLSSIQVAGKAAFEKQVMDRLDGFVMATFSRPVCRDRVQWEDCSHTLSGLKNHDCSKLSEHLHIISEGTATLADQAGLIAIGFKQHLETSYMGDEDLMVYRNDDGTFEHVIDYQIYGSGTAHKTLRMAGSGKLKDRDSGWGEPRPIRPTVMTVARYPGDGQVRPHDNVLHYLFNSMPSYAIQLKPGQELLTWEEEKAENDSMFPLNNQVVRDGEDVEYEKIPKAVLREMIMSLSKKRAMDSNRDQRNKVIWCISSCGGSAELAIEFYKQSGRAEQECGEAATRHWLEGQKGYGHKVTAGSLHHWLKEDLGEEEYKRRVSRWFPRVTNASSVTRANAKNEVMEEALDALEVALETSDKKINWTHIIRAMVLAGASQARVTEFTKNTEGAELVDQAWDNYTDMLQRGDIAAGTTKLFLLMTRHGVDNSTIDMLKHRFKRAINGGTVQGKQPQNTSSKEGAPRQENTILLLEEETTSVWLTSAGIKVRDVLKKMASWASAYVNEGKKEEHDSRLEETMNRLVPILNELFKYIEEGGGSILVRKPAKAGFRWVHHESMKVTKETFVQHKIGPISLMERWFNHKNREQHAASSNVPPLRMKEQDPDSFNRWTGLVVEHYPPVDLRNLPDQWQKLLDDLLDLLWDMCGGAKGDPEKKGFNWYCDHTAYILKYPGKKTGCFITFWSKEQGNGKSTSAYMIRAIIGPAHSIVITKNTEEVLFGPFNGHMEGMMFVELDDKAGNAALKKHEQDFLSMVTNPTQNIRRMRTDHATNVPAFEHYQGSGNHPPAHKTGARRNCTFKAGSKYLGKSKFFQRLYDALDDPYFQRVLYQWFTERAVEVGTNFQDTFPKDLQAMKDLDELRSPLEAQFFITRYFSSSEQLVNDKVQASVLLGQYNTFLTNKGLQTVSQTAFGTSLREMNMDGVTKDSASAGTFYYFTLEKLKTWMVKKRYMQAPLEIQWLIDTYISRVSN